jgi:hypothetical protein
MVDYHAMKLLRECICESEDFLFRQSRKSGCALI